MNKKTVYSDAPDDLGEVLLKGKKVDDFLPPPDQLVRRTMINEVLDKYVEKYSDTL